MGKYLEGIGVYHPKQIKKDLIENLKTLVFLLEKTNDVKLSDTEKAVIENSNFLANKLK